MERQPRCGFGSFGALSFKPDPKDGLIPHTLAFVFEQLPAWRDDPARTEHQSEKHLNSSLCDFLDHQSRSGLPMARFKHESLQDANRTVDIGVHGMEETTFIGFLDYSKYKPFLVIEAKRLPADRNERETEYVTGATSGGSPTGGIQRFKLGLHGKDVETAVMVGYIQQKTPNHWHGAINGWIIELATEPTPDECNWSSSDQLQKLKTDDKTRQSACQSSHERVNECVSSTITIHHFWICMRR